MRLPLLPAKKVLPILQKNIDFFLAWNRGGRPHAGNRQRRSSACAAQNCLWRAASQQFCNKIPGKSVSGRRRIHR